MNLRMILASCSAALSCALSVACVDDETVPARPTTAGTSVVVSRTGVTNAQPAPAPAPPVVYNVVQPTPPPATVTVTPAPAPAPTATTTTTTTTGH